MTAARARLLLATLSLIVVSACAPGATGSPSPTDDAPAGARPLLVDTDVAPDDLVAIAFLLASEYYDVAPWAT